MDQPEELTVGVESLERRQRSTRERLESLLSKVESDARESVNSEPHLYAYKSDLNPEQDTVIAPEESSGSGGEVVEPTPTPARREPPETGRVLKLAPDELVRLTPKMKSYLRSPEPTWPERIDAAGFMRSDLAVSKSLLGGDLCRHGPGDGGDRQRHRLDQGHGVFPHHPLISYRAFHYTIHMDGEWMV